MIFRSITRRRKVLQDAFCLSVIFISLNFDVFARTVDFRGDTDALGGGVALVSHYNAYSATVTAGIDIKIIAKDTEAAIAAADVNAALANAAPTAQNVTNTTLISNTDGQKAIDALRATDMDGSIASFTLVTLPAAARGKLYVNGAAAVAGQVINAAQAGQLTFDPEAGFYGSAFFTYTATDNLGARSANTATYTIPVNAAPVASDVSTDNTIPKGIARHRLPLLNGSDADGSIVSYTIVTLPTSQGTLWTAETGGTQITSAGQTITTNQLYFNPDGNGNNLPIRTFTYRVTDNKGVVSNTATFTIYINTEPIPSAVPVTATPLLNTAGSTAVTSLSATGGAVLDYRIPASSLPTTAQGILFTGATPITNLQQTAGYYVLTPAQATQLFFDPAVTAVNAVNFRYLARNATGSSPEVTYTIPIKSVPVARSITAPAMLNSTTAQVAIPALAATDADGTVSSFRVSRLPSSGTLYIGGVAINSGDLGVTYTATNGQLSGLTYLPAAGYTGTATFTYIATDNEGNTSSAATYSLPVTSPPVAKDITFELDPDARGFVLISALEATDDGAIASYKIVSLPDPTHGTLYLNAVAVTSGQELTPDEAKLLNFVKASTYLSPATFTYTAKDDMGFNAVNPVTYTIQVTNVSPLPVTLISFTAKVQQQAVVLAWATATELGNNYFVVERSADGKVFEAIGQVKGAGHSSQKLSYTFHDLGPITGTVYYRLKQVDFDGKSEYSKVAVVQSKESEKARLTLFPNPAIDVLNLDLAALDVASYTVRVLSKDGRVLQLQTLTGGAVQQVDVSGLRPGVYVLQVQAPQQPRTISFIKL